MRRRPRPRDHRRLPVIRLLLSLIAAARVFFRSRADIALEVLALRQQIGVLKRKGPQPRLSPLDRLFWTVLRTTWSHWRDALVIVNPETVVGWHRAGFRLYWRWKSRRRGGRPSITPELRALIRRLAVLDVPAHKLASLGGGVGDRKPGKGDRLPSHPASEAN